MFLHEINKEWLQETAVKMTYEVFVEEVYNVHLLLFLLGTVCDKFQFKL